MYKLITASLIILAIGFSACKKSIGVIPASIGCSIPWDFDTLTPPLAGTPLDGYSFLPASGVFISTKLSGSLTDISGNVHNYTRSWQTAIFPDQAIGIAIGTNKISVNGFFLNDTPTFLPFSHTDTVAIWNDTTLNHWFAVSTDSFQAINADIPGTMPSFSGSFPIHISRGSGFTFTFNSANVANGDSACVFIIAHNPSAFAQSKTVSASGGTAFISGSVLSTFANAPQFHFPLMLNSGPLYSGGYIVFAIYNHVIQTINGKQFAFVKQREYIAIVSFTN